MPLTGNQYEGDVAGAGAIYVGLHQHETVADSNMYKGRSLMEHAPSVIINAGYCHPPTITPLGVWDSVTGALPVYHDWTEAWHGFVRVGDPWAFRQVQDAGMTASNGYRLITLAPPGTSGTFPDPDPLLDAAPVYNRHGWELSGHPNRAPARMASAVGVLPFSLHVQDCSPPPPPAQVVPPPPGYNPFDDPKAYHRLLIADWIDPGRWPPRDNTLHDRDEEPWGYDYLARIRLRFYGKVTSTYAGDEAHLPVRIEELNVTTQQWVPLSLWGSDNFFSFVIGPGQPSSIDRFPNTDLYLGPRCNRTIRQGLFKVTLHPAEDATVTNRLLCDAGGAAYEPQPFTYFLNLAFQGCADIGITGGIPGHDGVWDNNDFVVFIDYFFTHDELADVGMTGGVPGSDHVWDNNDFVVFVDRFFDHTGCELTYQCGSPPGGGNIVGGGEGEGGLNRAGGSGGEMMNTGQPGAAGDYAAEFRAALQQMIANEPPGPRRDTLQGMLNALPPAPSDR